MKNYLLITALIFLLLISAAPAAGLQLAGQPQTIYTAGENCDAWAVTDGVHVLICDDSFMYGNRQPGMGDVAKGTLHLYNIAEKTLTTIPGTRDIYPWDIRVSGDDVYWQVHKFTDDPLVTEYDVYHYGIQNGVAVKLDISQLPRKGTDYLLSYKSVPGPDPYAVVITAENLRTGEKHIVPMPEKADAWTIKMSGDRMVFSDMPEKGGKALYLYDFASRKVTLIDEVQDGVLKMMDFSGETILYIHDYGGTQKLYSRNLATNQTKLMSDFPMNYDETDLDETLAVWRGWYWNDDFSRPDRVATPLYAASIAGGDLPVLLDTGSRTPSTGKNVIVWSKWDDDTERDVIRLAVFQ